MGFAPGGVAVGTGAVRLVARLLASLLFVLASIAGVSADEFRTPAVSVVRVDWRAALDQLRSEIGTQPAVVPSFTFSGRRRLPGFDPRAMPALVQLNAVTSKFFTGIGRSPVPVLLPFDTAAFLGAQSNGATAGPSLSRYQADFRPVDLFDAGQAGYDAVFSLEPGAGDGMPQRTFAKPVEVQITGSILVYDINDPQGGKGEPVKSLASQFPDLRRFIREGYVRYAFTRFGVPYVVSIQCLDSSPRPRRLACREAYPVAERFLKALHVAGGLPSPRADGCRLRGRRAAARGFARFHLSPGRRHHRPQRIPQAGRPRRFYRLLPNSISPGRNPCFRAFAIIRQAQAGQRAGWRTHQLPLAG